MTHKIKIQKEFADAVLNGDKPFEVRRDDRCYQKGDIVEYNVIDGRLNRYTHKLDSKRYEITYVLGAEEHFGIKSGHVVFGIREVAE